MATRMLDLGPQARQLKVLLDGVRDDRLGAPTPCEEYAVRDLLDHLLHLSTAFTDAARKDLGATTATAPRVPGPPLPEDWRTLLPRRLDELVAAWRSEDAWQGETQAGGVTLPGAVAGVVAVNELLLHGWDLARATGQPHTGDPDSVRACAEMLAQFGDREQEGAIFGPVVEVPDDASVLERVVALGGRRPDWAPPES